MSLESKVADALAEAVRDSKAAREDKGAAHFEEKESEVVTPPVFTKKFKDDKDGLKFSEVFGVAPPNGLPDLRGVTFTPEDWPEEDRMFIPNQGKFMNYVPNVTNLYKLWVSVLKNNKKSLIVGPTGSGKTSIVEYFCAMINQPHIRFGGRQDMESDSILGRPWVSGGEMKFLLGELPKAAEKGWFILFDEPWKTPTGIQMSLQRFYENDGIFQIDDMPGDLADKMITPKETCRLVLADNVVGTGDSMDQYAATMIQDGSTLDRLAVIIKQSYMDQEDEVNMVLKAEPHLSKETATSMVKFFTLCRTSYEQRALSASMSPRNLLAWAELATQLGDVREAARWVILERFADDTESNLVREHYRTVFDEKL